METKGVPVITFYLVEVTRTAETLKPLAEVVLSLRLEGSFGIHEQLALVSLLAVHSQADIGICRNG